jgi:uncharacterized OB-fold protein
MSETKTVHALDGFFADTAEGPRLLGSRCATCGTAYFPRSPLCHNPECSGSKVEDANLGADGKLWSVAIQNYPPPPPSKFNQPYTPYAMGVVDTTDGLRVLTQIATDDPQSLQIGCDVRLVIDELYREADGTSVLTWKYRPVV